MNEKTDDKKAHEIRKEFINEFKKASIPLLKYLNKNHHPHVTAIVTSTSIELVEGICTIPKIYDFIKD